MRLLSKSDLNSIQGGNKLPFRYTFGNIGGWIGAISIFPTAWVGSAIGQYSPFIARNNAENLFWQIEGIGYSVGAGAGAIVGSALDLIIH